MARRFYKKTKTPPALRMALYRLQGEGKVVSCGYGEYCSTSRLVRHEVDFSLYFHGVTVQACYNGMGRSFLDMKQRVSTLCPPRIDAFWPKRPHPKNSSESFSMDWLGRDVTITVHTEKSGRIMMHCHASDHPFNLLELYIFLTGTIVTTTGIPAELWSISQIGVNDDVRGTTDSLNLVGLSIASLGKLVVQIYQKKPEEARLEAHCYEKIPVTVMKQKIERILNFLDETTRGEGK